MLYRNADTGEVFTLEEMKRLWEQFGHETKFDTFEDFLDAHEKVDTWYAVQYDSDDNDWGTGSCDLDEAKQMCLENGYRQIAVIDVSSEYPICVEVIEM